MIVNANNKSAIFQKKILLKSAKSTLCMAVRIILFATSVGRVPPKNCVSKITASLILLVLLLPLASCAQTQTTELLNNPGFESFSTGSNQPWEDNSWGGATATYFPEKNNVRNGNYAQKITVTSLGSGKVQFRQNYTFLKGRKYQASLWLRAATAMPINIMLRENAHPFRAYAIKTVQVGTEWQKVTIKGKFHSDVYGSLMVIPETVGTFWIDDASLVDTTAPLSESVVLQGNVPDEYLGLHINCKGCFSGSWPSANFGIWRLWDAGVTWKDLEPSKGQWNWQTMDYLTSEAQKHGVKVIYTLGITPQWAAARPNDGGVYGAGSSSEPKNIEDWRAYVRTVATRYKGKIHHYEIWNEVNYQGHWTGTVDKMIELTKEAYQIIKEVDPSAKVLTPNCTWDIGNQWMNDFLFKGGAQYADVVSYHWYFGIVPENILPHIWNLRQLMQSYGIHKPVWNTEGAAIKEKNYVPTDDEARGSVARAYITQWAFGVSNLSWYMWDMDTSNHADWVKITSGDRITPTIAGIAYREVIEWLKGAQMTKKNFDDATNTWIITLKRENGYVGRIIWNTSDSRNFPVPASWGIVRKRDLAGSSINVRGTTSVSIGKAPILLEN